MKCEEPIRAFIAIEVTDEVRRNIASFQSFLKNTQANIKVVNPENIHFTLVFLRDIDASIVGLVSDTIAGTVESVAPFSFEVCGVGFFGRRHSPRVVWAGAKGDLEPLLDIQKRLVVSLRELGLDFEERPYTPHLTLARVRSPKNVDELLSALESRKDERFGQVEVKRLVLIKSELQPQGPRYTVIHELALWNSE